ncbi:MAG: GNAT family N-acetyltransferase [Oscillospiraceae bacterium]|nr:GNAT family N-acetyltransferase [Oscillospiraceae bacterium]
MNIKISTLNVGNKDIDCSEVIQWATKWDWGVGKIVAGRLTNKDFNDWETIVVLTIDEQYAGFCILEKKDSWGTDIDSSLTPFITAVYVDPKFRGRRLSKILLKSASDVANSLGFGAVYLISSQQEFYEKFGFEKYVQTVTLSGSIEAVYKKSI